jgi:hypothetical protein
VTSLALQQPNSSKAGLEHLHKGRPRKSCLFEGVLAGSQRTEDEVRDGVAKAVAALQQGPQGSDTALSKLRSPGQEDGVLVMTATFVGLGTEGGQDAKLLRDGKARNVTMREERAAIRAMKIQ